MSCADHVQRKKCQTRRNEAHGSLRMALCFVALTSRDHTRMTQMGSFRWDFLIGGVHDLGWLHSAGRVADVCHLARRIAVSVTALWFQFCRRSRARPDPRLLHVAHDNISCQATLRSVAEDGGGDGNISAQRFDNKLRLAISSTMLQYAVVHWYMVGLRTHPALLLSLMGLHEWRSECLGRLIATKGGRSTFKAFALYPRLTELRYKLHAFLLRPSQPSGTDAMLGLLRGTDTETGLGGVDALEAAEACIRDSYVILCQVRVDAESGSRSQRSAAPKSPASQLLSF